MSVVSLLSNYYSGFHKALIFLMRLAWKCRIRLPYLIMIGFVVLDNRFTIEIVIDVEHHIPDHELEQLDSSSESDDSDDLEEETN